MAKSRAQRKAEKRAREAEARARAEAGEVQAQHDTQVGKSGDVAEVEAVEAGIAAGAREEDLETPAASGGLESKQSRRERRQAERQKKAERKRQEETQLAKREKQATAQTRQRSGVFAFLSSSAAELKRVQWPDRDTLIQASAVTLVFCFIFAVYLGLLDLGFNWLVQRVL